ncbi:MAG: LysE family transporter [Bacteroidales bacterium]|jgi:threonine/homoserine/homoserine lactone efflux protein|nr:LysE family transporter [Bacteroidales bacterium]
MVESFIKGFIVGMGASIPLGPLGVMCVQKTLSKGRMSGFVTGLGASLADTLFASFAILSLALIQEFVNNHEASVLFFGGLAVVIIGLKIFLTNPVKQIRNTKGGKRLFEDFLSSVIMTITNPGAVFLILGLFAFVGLNVDGSSAKMVITAALGGVFAGALAWWIILSTSINIFRNKFRLRQLLTINRVAGVVIMVLGLISFLDGSWRYIMSYFR